MSFSASIPLANLKAANDALELAGFGPNNFSVPAYSNGPSPTHGLLHAWTDAAFQAAVAALPGVVIQNELADPTVTTKAVATTAGCTWGQDANLLTGTVTPGLHKDAQGNVWWVIQSYNTATYPDPKVIPALIRKARNPHAVEAWEQPLDGFNAYKLSNPFTGKPDRCTYNGKTWVVSQADGAGNNVWTPGVSGWTEVLPEGAQAPAAPAAWVQPTGAQDAYAIGARVTFNGSVYESKINANVWSPTAYPAGWKLV